MKIRDINYEDMPEFAFIIDKYDKAASICLIEGHMKGKEEFEKAKLSIQAERLDKEFKVL